MHNKIILMLLCMVVSLSACTRTISPNVYKASHVGETSMTYRGVIVNARPVEIHEAEKAEDNAFGTVAGGVGGGLAGSAIGKGSGNTAAIAGGAILGAVAGNLIQNELGKQQGMEYVVELKDGRMMTIVQGLDPVYNVGQRVLVMQSHKGRSRIAADTSIQ